MIKEFGYGKAMRIIGIVCCIILLLAFIVAPIHFWLNEPEKTGLIYAFLGGAVFFIPISILGILDVLKSKIVISNNTIKKIGVFKTVTFKAKHIEKYEKDINYLVIYSKKKEQKPIRISNYFTGNHEILSWLESDIKARDKEEIDKKAQYKELSKKYDYGSTKGEKGVQKLKQAKTVAKTINAISILVAISMFFLSYEITMILSIAIGLSIFLIVFSYGGLIKYFQYNKRVKNTSIYPSVGFGAFFVSSAILLRSSFRMTLLNGDELWVPLIIGAILITAICMIGSKLHSIRKGKDFGTFLSIIIFAFGFAYGTIMFFNEYLDNSQSKTYSLEVEDKRIKKSRRSDSYLLISSQKPSEDFPTDYSVSNRLYNEKQIGDTFYVLVRQGKFGISYYKVRGKQ
jgi:hypothetical protein